MNGVRDIAKIHVPYWQTKSQPIVSVATQHEHAGKIIEELVNKKVASGQPSAGSGWLDQCGRRAAAVKTRIWDAVDECIKEFEEHSELFADIVRKMQRRTLSRVRVY